MFETVSLIKVGFVRKEPLNSNCTDGNVDNLTLSYTMLPSSGIFNGGPEV